MTYIQFRAKGINSNEFCYGFLYAENFPAVKYYIHNGFTKKEVNPNTIGQFTGVIDKHGTNVFEGDIIAGINGSVNGNGGPFSGIIEWDDKLHGFSMPNFASDEDSTHNWEVVGNIYDNSELIEKKALYKGELLYR